MITHDKLHKSDTISVRKKMTDLKKKIILDDWLWNNFFAIATLSLQTKI